MNLLRSYLKVILISSRERIMILQTKIINKIRLYRNNLTGSMKKGLLLDKNMDMYNYVNFKECQVLENGTRVQFVYANGVSYNVPLEYILSWFYEPHYILDNGKLKDWDDTKFSVDAENVHALKCRRVRDWAVIRIYLSNSTAYDVVWDTVLMSCEPNYEHFGGLTIESRKDVDQWFSERGHEIIKTS